MPIICSPAASPTGESPSYVEYVSYDIEIFFVITSALASVFTSVMLSTLVILVSRFSSLCSELPLVPPFYEFLIFVFEMSALLNDVSSSVELTPCTIVLLGRFVTLLWPLDYPGELLYCN